MPDVCVLFVLFVCVVGQVDAGGSGSRLISELRVNEIVAVTEVPEDTGCGWLGGFRVRHPEQSGWFPAHVVSRAPAARAVKGKLAKMLPESDRPSGMDAEAQMMREEEQILDQLGRHGDNNVPEADSYSDGSRAAAEGRTPDRSADGSGNGSTPQAGSPAGWTVAASPRTPAAAERSSPGSAMLASGAARKLSRCAVPEATSQDVPPPTPSDARP
eukprot:COSAG02_NODE_113_length_35905_cov_25.229012_3_plen_215_part_00